LAQVDKFLKRPSLGAFKNITNISYSWRMQCHPIGWKKPVLYEMGLIPNICINGAVVLVANALTFI